MDPTDPILAAIYAKFTEKAVNVLVQNAAKAYVAGDILAVQRMGEKYNPSPVTRGAVDYLANYRRDLIEKGGSMVTVDNKDGTFSRVFQPWLKDYAMDDRNSIADIINRGISDGKPTGVRESSRGYYPKDSIAGELQEYFTERKSHASTIARTETMGIVNDASMERYKQAGVKFVKRLEGGPHMCDACRALSGKVFPIDEAPPATIHPNCVGTNSPVMEVSDADGE